MDERDARRRNSPEALWVALNDGASPIVVIWVEALGLLEWHLSEVESYANPEWPVRRLTDLEDVLAADPSDLVLFTPTNERATIEDLEGARDSLVDREVPIVLFLIRGGDGQDALREHPSIASWLLTSEVDPDGLDEIDHDKERARFQEETGLSPEEWLAEWRADRIERTLKSFALFYRAALVEER